MNSGIGSPEPSARTSSTEAITIGDAKDALLRSGYLLESRIETLLRKRAFYVQSNAAYPDANTGKTREFDVYGMKAFNAGKDEGDYVFEVLLVECINNSQPLVFITKSPQSSFLHASEVKLAGMPVKLPVDARAREWISLADFLGMDTYHHSCNGRIAAQFCSFVRKKPNAEWMATHEDAHFDALQKLCAVTEYMVGKHFTSWVLANRRDERVNIEFYYPVVVLQGKMLEARAGGSALTLREANHIQFRRSAIVGAEETHYHIDIVTEQFFSQFLRLLDAEMSRTAKLLSRRSALVQKAIDKLWRSAHRLKSRDKIRAVLEF